MDRLRPTVDFVIVKKSETNRVPVPKPITEFKAVKYAVAWIHDAVMTPDATKRYATKGLLLLKAIMISSKLFIGD